MSIQTISSNTNSIRNNSNIYYLRDTYPCMSINRLYDIFNELLAVDYITDNDFVYSIRRVQLNEISKITQFDIEASIDYNALTLILSGNIFDIFKLLILYTKAFEMENKYVEFAINKSIQYLLLLNKDKVLPFEILIDFNPSLSISDQVYDKIHLFIQEKKKIEKELKNQKIIYF
jgi:hypothetical protein